jgi:hypothetical protein
LPVPVKRICETRISLSVFGQQVFGPPGAQKSKSHEGPKATASKTIFYHLLFCPVEHRRLRGLSRTCQEMTRKEKLDQRPSAPCIFHFFCTGSLGLQHQ